MAMTHATVRPGETQSQGGWRQPTLSELLQRPLPHLGLIDRVLARVFGFLMLPRFKSITGLEHIGRDGDPCIVAFNHASRLEAIALPALLIYHRGGRRVHFLADWNFALIPGVGFMYRRAGVIVVTRKSAKPRMLNVLKPLFAKGPTSIERARAHLAAGRSVGIFPEGTVNRHPDRLLRGRFGAARLSLETGVPIVPAGVRVSRDAGGRAQLELAIGPPLYPQTSGLAESGLAQNDPARSVDPARIVKTAQVRLWHATVMKEIARLSGKAWEPPSQEPSDGTP